MSSLVTPQGLVYLRELQGYRLCDLSAGFGRVRRESGQIVGHVVRDGLVWHANRDQPPTLWHLDKSDTRHGAMWKLIRDDLSRRGVRP